MDFAKFSKASPQRCVGVFCVCFEIDSIWRVRNHPKFSKFVGFRWLIWHNSEYFVQASTNFFCRTRGSMFFSFENWRQKKSRGWSWEFEYCCNEPSCCYSHYTWNSDPLSCQLFQFWICNHNICTQLPSNHRWKSDFTCRWKPTSSNFWLIRSNRLKNWQFWNLI